MKSGTNPSDGQKAGAQPEATLLERIQAHFKTALIKRSIEREIDQEVKRFSYESQKQRLSLIKERLKKDLLSGHVTLEPKSSSAPRSLPKVLNIKQSECPVDEPIDQLSKFQFTLTHAVFTLRRKLILNQDDLTRLAQSKLARQQDRIAACYRLIQKSEGLSLDQVQKTKLTILQKLLTALEDENYNQQAQLDKKEKQSIERRLRKSQSLLDKTQVGSTKSAQAISRLEQRVSDQEQLLAQALDASGGVINLSPAMFEEIEKKIDASEKVAKESLEAIAGLPPVETKSMSAEQIDKALSAYDQVVTQLVHSCEQLTAAECGLKHLIGQYEEKAKIWRERQSDALKDGNEELAKQAGIRALAVLESLPDLVKPFQSIRKTKDEALKQLGEITLLCETLKDRKSKLEISD
ncbi:MAG: hypothetical protein WCT03_04905 [Candidatus Obscuribacterales bacterium]|jgi:hypothetical protein